jgi:sigma-E factor negative regulatory protein RseA
MKQEISALMDNELFEDQADSLLDRIKRSPGAHQDWELYHLIGDVLHQPEHIHCDLSARISERIQDEPTVLAPRLRGFVQTTRTFALSAAATLAAVSVVAWMSQQFNADTALQAAIQLDAIRPISIQSQPKSNPYLMAHMEFSPSADMSGGASYINSISYIPEDK